MRRGLPLYVDLLDKVRSLPVAHADETSWRNDGTPHWVWYGGNEDLGRHIMRTAEGIRCSVARILKC